MFKSISLAATIAAFYIFIKGISLAFKTGVLVIIDILIVALFEFDMFRIGHNAKSFDFTAIKHLFWAVVLYTFLAFIIRHLIMTLLDISKDMNATIMFITFVISVPLIIIASFGALRYAFIANNVYYANNICIIVALLTLEILRKNSAVKVKVKGDA